jgi:tRNA pseudouridine55 synthase
MNEDKVYTGVMRFGQTTDSYDAETPIHEERILPANFEEALVQALPLFSGDITQEVPIYSAVKKGGKRLYRYARAGEEVTLPKRNVTIKRFTVTMINDTDASFEVACSKGTYIRSLAHELGQHLGVGAHLIALRRTMIGYLSVAEASRLDQETTSMD